MGQNFLKGIQGIQKKKFHKAFQNSLSAHL